MVAAPSTGKYNFTHEIGHRVTQKIVGGKAQGNCADLQDDTSGSGHCPSNPPVLPVTARKIHSMTSIEFQRCAFSEGAAYFYAVDIFNRHDQDDCVFRYYGFEQSPYDYYPTVNCEDGANHRPGDYYPAAFMETVCTAWGPAWAGRGVELDWMRTFWGVHTSGSTPPSYNAMLLWMKNAADWSSGSPTVFEALDDRAELQGGALNGNWEAAAPANGIDH